MQRGPQGSSEARLRPPPRCVLDPQLPSARLKLPVARLWIKLRVQDDGRE